MTTIDMIFSNKTKISLAEYLSLNAQERDNISNVDIIPPRLGDSSFGAMEVTYKMGRYVMKDEF